MNVFKAIKWLHDNSTTEITYQYDPREPEPYSLTIRKVGDWLYPSFAYLADVIFLLSREIAQVICDEHIELLGDGSLSADEFRLKLHSKLADVFREVE